MASELQSVTDALKQSSISEPVENEGSVISLLSSYLESNQSDSARVELLDSLLEVIEGDQSEDRKLALFQESSLTLLPLLLPLVQSKTVAPPATELVRLCCRYARPREAVLALGEVLESLQDQTETFDVSDDEDDFDEEEEDRGILMGRLMSELEAVIESYTIVIPRLPNKRSTPTILRLCNALEPLLTVLSHFSTATSARDLLESLSRLLRSVWYWAEHCEDSGGEQKSLLSGVLFVSVTLLGPRLSANLLERWFLRTFPRYVFDSARAIQTSLQGQVALEEALLTACILGHTPDSFIHAVTHPTSITPHNSLASLILLAAGLCEEQGDLRLPTDGMDLSSTLQDSMPVLTAALSGTAVDAGLVWTWAVLHGAPATTVVDFDTLSMLLEILVPLTAMHPSADARLALLKLLSRLCSTASTASDELLLLKQLVEPENPFEEVRLSGLSIIREKLSDPDNQRLLVPEILGCLGDCCFQLPPGPEPTLDLPLADLIGTMWPSWFTECLNLFWILWNVDAEGKTGVRSKSYLSHLKDSWLIPMRARLGGMASDNLASEGVDGHAIDFVLSRWSAALDRVEAAVSGSND